MFLDKSSFAKFVKVLDSLAKPELSRSDTSAWPAVVAAAGGSFVPPTVPRQLMRVPIWELEVTPGYAPVRAGKPSPEDDSPFSEELNQLVRKGDTARIQQLFGSSRPFKAQWSFQATNLTTGASVPVRVGRDAQATEARADFVSSALPQGSAIVTFPQEPVNVVHELIATVKMTDAFGMTGSGQHRLSSHALIGETEGQLVEVVLPLVAALTGVSPEELVAASQIEDLPPDDRAIMDSRSRRARMLRLFAMSAAQDKLITIGELRPLIDGAKLFGSQ